MNMSNVRRIQISVLLVIAIIAGVSTINLVSTGKANAAANPQTVSPSGLVGWWKLNEGSGTTANDTSGNGYDGTLVNGPIYTTTVPFPSAGNPYALLLDGTNQYIDLPDAVANVSEFTFAAWVYWEGGGHWQRIFDFGQDMGNYLMLTPSSGSSLRFVIKDDWDTEQRLNATILPTNEWVHVAVTLSEDTARLYVNGVKQDENTAITYSIPDVIGANTWLGRSQYNVDPYFAGMLDDVRVYNRALSATEIDLLANSLGGWWKLDEGTGTTASDTSGNGYDGTLVNGPIYTTTVPFPSAGNPYALLLDGTNQYIDLPDAVANVSEFTFAAWVYWEGGGHWQRIFDFGQDMGNYLMLTPSSGSSLRFVIKDDWDTEQRLNATILPTNEWVHVAVTLSEDTARLYVNGVKQDENTAITYSIPDVIGTNTWLGKSQYGSDPYFAGMLDDVRVYGQELSQSEIKRLAGSRVYLPLVVQATGR